MIRLKIFFVFIFLFFCYTQSYANDALTNPRDTTIYDKCVKKAQKDADDAGADPEVALTECANKELKRLDKILNDSYKKIMNSKKIDQKDKENIKNLQRNWLAYRKHMLNTILKYLLTDNPVGDLMIAGDKVDLLRSQAILMDSLVLYIEDGVPY